MASTEDFSTTERHKFQHCFSKLMSFTYRDEESSRTNLNLLIDQLNALECSYNVVREAEAGQLLTRLCGVVPLHQERLMVKLCQLMVNLRTKHKVTLGDKCVLVVADYLVKAVQRCQPWALADVLSALATILYENCDKVGKMTDVLLGSQGILVQLTTDVQDEDVFREAVQCLENITAKPSGGQYLNEAQTRTCFDIFAKLMHKVPTVKMEQITQCKALISCLRGLQNILQTTKTMPVDQLGLLLAGVRVFMFYGLYNQPVVVPERLYPAPLSQYEVSVPFKSSVTSQATEKQEQSGKAQSQKKPRKKKGKKTTDKDETVGSDTVSDVTSVPAASAAGSAAEKIGLPEELSLRPTWAKISSSESDWSDTEGGQGSRFKSYSTKVRQSALGCFHCIIKTTEKKLMFGYWSLFIPDSPSTANMADTQTLFTIILKDPSPKCRMGALAALSALVDGTKPLLAAAEDNEDVKTPYLSFSVILGSMLKEIHRCLLLAMVSESYSITLTQLIKCFGTVISNVPYHRLRPGLLSRVVKQIRHFINHRDPNVRVACLTCLGAMASIQPPLMEVCHIVQTPKPPLGTKFVSPLDFDAGQSKSRTELMSQEPANQRREAEDSGFSSSDSPRWNPAEGERESENVMQGSPGGLTPVKGSSGTQTPVFSDQVLQAQAKEISWVVKLCIRNILPQATGDRNSLIGEDLYVEPLPVRLESLQCLAHLTKGYFPIIRNSVMLLKELIHKCYQDPDPAINLHAAKLLDEFTQVLAQDVQSSDRADTPDRLSHQQVLEFWMSLLNGPVPTILQSPSNSPLRATTCDCIANVGADIFSVLPTDKRIMCITMVLGLTSDEDKTVRSSAVRTLGVYVLYRCLREDVSFVADCGNSIIACMEDKSVVVRIRGAWSLANLCDALALNREEGDNDFMEDFSDSLLLKLITVATKACQDSDKVKANGVRALGNILRYLPDKIKGSENFDNAVSGGVKALAKNMNTGAMKVRWNACYAASNMFKNQSLPHGTAPWTADLMKALCVVVKDCKNFKVKINAALALTSPCYREHYGDTTLYCVVWDSLIISLKSAEHVTDFAEYRYRDGLVDQICGAVLHLTSIATQDDLRSLLPIMRREGEVLLSCLDSYHTNLPMMSQIGLYLPSALQHVEQLSATQLEDEQRDCVVILTQICRQLLPGDELEGERTPEKSAFVQTYD